MSPRIRRTLFGILRIYLIVLVLVGFFQRKLLYMPFRDPEEAMIRKAAATGLEPWRDKAGALIGWQRVGGGANKLLVFHGNAGNAVHRSGYADAFGALGGGTEWDVWICEYPGYGARPGSPSREAFAKAAAHAARELAEMDARPVFVLGESIGSGVACDLASAHPEIVRGLVLVTPFARLADVAAAKFPFLPVRLLLLDRWDNVAALSSGKTKAAFIIAGRDEVVGAKQGNLLYESLKSPKTRIDFPHATHNDPEIHDASAWAQQASEFLLGP